MANKVEETLTCRVCNTSGQHPIWVAHDMMYLRNESFNYFQCINCKCLQIDELPIALKDYYPKDYYSFSPLSDRKLSDGKIKKTFRYLYRTLGTSVFLGQKKLGFPLHYPWLRVANIKVTDAILDIGCGNGALLNRMHKEGFLNTYGIDPYIDSDIQYKNGLTISKTSITELERDDFFDFIMMHHSLEHVPDQEEIFSHLYRLLKPGGIALLRIPVSSSFAWEHYQENWVQLDPPRHLYLHSEKSIGLLASKANLKVCEVIYDSLPFQFSGSELCKAGVLIPQHDSYIREKKAPLFTEKQHQEWMKKTRVLNKESRGDMACFFIRKE